MVHANGRFQGEIKDFIRRHHHTFTYNICGRGADFDLFAKWTFKIKGHTPRLRSMKHIILNIHAPTSDRPIEIWHIWNYLKTFSKEFGCYKRIQKLTVRFVEHNRDVWASNAKASAVMDIALDEGFFDDSDAGLILVLLSCLITNVINPTVVLPRSFDGIELADSFIERAEWSMTGKWRDPEILPEFTDIESLLEYNVRNLERRTEQLSKHV